MPRFVGLLLIALAVTPAFAQDSTAPTKPCAQCECSAELVSQGKCCGACDSDFQFSLDKAMKLAALVRVMGDQALAAQVIASELRINPMQSRALLLIVRSVKTDEMGATALASAVAVARPGWLLKMAAQAQSGGT